MLELFLLNYGIEPVFFESEYNQYWQDVMFDNEELTSFHPDILFIHTSSRNIQRFPSFSDSSEEVEALLDQEYGHYEALWEKAASVYGCPIIQNNFELPFFRIIGNKSASDIHGRVHFVQELNRRFYQYAQSHDNFYINDILYLSSCYGLKKWADPFYWHMYKYALAVPAIPELSFSVANIIKSIYGKNKKALVLDLDNTLWGGIVGDDGPDKIEIGQETSLGQIYSEFQQYIKLHQELGILLNIDSKNEEQNALAGLNHPDSILKPDDFIVIKANWEPKDQNLRAITETLNIGADSIVFVDDNPAERHIVASQIPETATPEIGTPETYISVLDGSGYFEMTTFSQDDRKRNEMYKDNAKRARLQSSYASYEDYLRSLDMKGTIKPFEPLYMSRISQLTNKSNQFNLTTKRYSQAEIESTAADPLRITLYGKLEDRFGDNGVVSIVIGRREENTLHIELWLMSCRVLKRDMEYALMDELVSKCKEQGIDRILGYYYPTAKNGMVKEFYGLQGFSKLSEDAEGNTVWEYKIGENYKNRNEVIEVNGYDKTAE